VLLSPGYFGLFTNATRESTSVNRDEFHIAYVSRLLYPDSSAAALQTIQMSHALAAESASTQLFVHDCLQDEAELFDNYAIQDSKLWIRSKNTTMWPQRLYNDVKLRFMTFNSLVALEFLMAKQWRQCKGQCILIVRSRLEALYWGLLRPFLWWMRSWVFIYEAHNLELGQDRNANRIQRTQTMLRRFDHVIAVTQELADDIHKFTNGRVNAEVIRLCSALPRLETLPKVKFSDKNIRLGYFGTIDKLHGIEILVEAMRYLPEDIHLRITGELHSSAEQLKEQVKRDASLAARVEFMPRIPYSRIADAIDECDIVLLPSGLNSHSSRYRSPLKLFDYMVRGKPIIAADVVAHREILENEVDSILYRPDDPQQLANVILYLSRSPEIAQFIAHNCWIKSNNFTYRNRALEILATVRLHI